MRDLLTALVRCGISNILVFLTLTACSGSEFRQSSSELPSLTASNIARVGVLPRPFDERSMKARREAMPITAAQLAGFPHINPIIKHTVTSRSPQNTGDQDNGGQSGYIIAPGNLSGDGSIYIAMTAYDDAWITTPTDGYYNTVNAPTSHGPNGDCIETVTNYYNGFGTPGTTVDQVQFYDFCANNGQGAFVGAIPIDANFVRDYVRTYADDNHQLPRYVSAVIHSALDNRWHAYLYDASLMQYVDYYDSPIGANTTVLGSEGWSIFETHYNGGPCSTLPDTSEEGIQVRTSSGWQTLNGNAVSSYMWGTCFSPPLSVPYYAPAFSTSPSVAWTVMSEVAPALSEYARVILADSPLVYYRLGDSGASAIDSSGIAPALNGTYGANVKRDVTSLLAVEASNGAAQFMGGSSVPADFISIPPEQRLQPAKSVSIEAWISIGSTNSGTVDLVSYGPEAAGQAYTMQLLPNETIAAYITTPTGYGFASDKTVLTANRAYLIDATYDGSKLAVYVNGVLDGYSAVTGVLNYSNVNGTNGLSLGSAFSSYRQAFVGTLDEVALFGTALTAAQIAAHWTAGSGVAVAPSVSEYAATVSADAPAAFYRLSDATNVAVDASPNHISAAYGSAVKREVAGLLSTDSTNNGAQFPGGASSPQTSVTTSRNTKLEPLQSVSIEAWVEAPANPAGTIDLVSYGPEQLGQPYTLQLFPNGTVGMFVTTTSAAGWGLVQGRTALNLNTPHLIDGTYNGSVMNIYVDGNIDASQTTTGTLNYRNELTQFGLSIGTAFDDTYRSTFAGELDDVAIYGSALTAQRVAAHWSAGSGHVFAPMASRHQ
jgi:hypothetical protein